MRSWTVGPGRVFEGMEEGEKVDIRERRLGGSEGGQASIID